MKVHGQCHCGAIAYEIEIDPDDIGICHCADCQVMSGAAFRVLAFAPEQNFRLLRGQPKTYVKTADSGRRRQLLFCADCGTSLYSVGEEDGPKILSIRVGPLSDRARLVPKIQYWHRSALPWLGDLASIPRQETQ